LEGGEGGIVVNNLL